MNGLTGMEKFSHLEDKIYLTIEFAKKMREEREKLAAEIDVLKDTTESAVRQQQILEDKVGKLLAERDSILLKVEAMIEAVASIDTDVAEAVGK